MELHRAPRAASSSSLQSPTPIKGALCRPLQADPFAMHANKCNHVWRLDSVPFCPVSFLWAPNLIRYIPEEELQEQWLLSIRPFSTDAETCVPTSNVQGFLWLLIAVTPAVCYFWHSHPRVDRVVVLVCISLWISNIEHLFLHCMPICTSSLCTLLILIKLYCCCWVIGVLTHFKHQALPNIGLKYVFSH